MKTCRFCQLATRRTFVRSTRDFQRRVPRISNFLMVFVILEHTVCFRCYFAAKTIAFPIESCTFTPQNGGKSYPGCDVMFALPTRLGGLGLPNPSKQCDLEFSASQAISGLLKESILQQRFEYSFEFLDAQIFNQTTATRASHKGS